MILFLVNKKRWIFNEERQTAAGFIPAANSIVPSSTLEINNLSATNVPTEMTNSSESLLIDPIEMEKILELELKAVKALKDMLNS